MMQLFCLVLFVCLPEVVISSWKQARFATSFWVDPLVEASDFPQAYQQVANANFSVIMGGFGATSLSDIQAQVDAVNGIDKLGVIVHASGDVSTFYNASGQHRVWGYQLKDEPSATEFPELANWTRAVRAAYPDKLKFINLLPNYASPSQLGVPTYGDYVTSFVKMVEPDILCMDHYPRFSLPDTVEGSNVTRAGYRDNLAVFREVGLQYKIGFWNFFNNMPYTKGLPGYTEGQLRWQAFTSLAYGAKGVLYFTYWAPQGFSNAGAIISPVRAYNDPNATLEFVPGPHYVHAQRINSKLIAYGNYMMEAISVGVWHVVDKINNNSSASQLNGSVITDLTGCQKLTGTCDYLVGQFSVNSDINKGQDGDSTGHQAGLIVLQNQDPNFGMWINVKLQNDLEHVQEVSPITGNLVVLMDQAPLEEGLTLWLDAGDARLLHFMAPASFQINQRIN